MERIPADNTPEEKTIPPEQKKDQGDEIGSKFEKEKQHIDLDKATEDAADDIVKELSSHAYFESADHTDNKRTLSQRISDRVKKYLKQSSIGAVFGFVSTSVVRSVVRHSALVYLGGSMGAGAVAGAVVGATIEGVKVYAKERKKFVATDIISQLNDTNDPLQKAAIVSKAEENLREARVNDSPEVKDLVECVRAARLHIETSLHKEELASKSEAQQISWLLKTSGRTLKEIPRSERKKAKLLLKEIEFKSEKSKVDFGKVGRAIVKGGLIGALGGAIGGALSHYVFDTFHPGQWLEHVVKPLQESMPGISKSQAEELAQKALQQKSEVAAGAVARVFEEGKNQLLHDKFVITAQHGDGWTHLARKAVHDYLVNLHELSPGSAPHLSTEQLVHIEDTLVKEKLHSGVEELIHPGQEFEISGAHIQSLIEKAQGLTPEKIQNIHAILATPEHHLSLATTSWMTDFGSISNPDNDFAREIALHAKEVAQSAVAAAQEIIATPPIPSASGRGIIPQGVEKGVETPHYVKSLLALLGVGVLGGYALKKIVQKKQIVKSGTEEPEVQKSIIGPLIPAEEPTEEPVSPTAPIPEPSEISPIPTPPTPRAPTSRVKIPEEEQPLSKPEVPPTPRTHAGRIAEEKLGEIRALLPVPFEVDPKLVRGDMRKELFEKLWGIFSQLSKEDFDLLVKNAPRGIFVGRETRFYRDRQRIEISRGEGDEYILEHIKRSASDEEQRKLAEADARFLILQKELETSDSLSIKESEDIQGMPADRRIKVMDYIRKIISLLNVRDIENLKIIAPNGIEIRSFDFSYNEIEHVIRIGESFRSSGKDRGLSAEQITIKGIRNIIKEKLATQKSGTRVPTSQTPPNNSPVTPLGPSARSRESIPKLEKRNWWEIKRDTEVMAVEDLSGNMRTFERHVKELGVAKKDSSGHWQWTGGNKKVVFLGDILGDRSLDGVEITAIIEDLADQAGKQGGQVDVLCGNHDMDFIHFLCKDRGDKWAEINANHLTRQNIGIWELARFDPDPNSELKKIDPLIKVGREQGSTTEEFKKREKELWGKLYKRMPEILKNMRTDPEGKKILEAMCRIKMATIYDDTLFCHTDPTIRMVFDLTKKEDIPGRVLEINIIVQENLRGALFEGKKFDSGFKEIDRTYTYTDNRDYFVEQKAFTDSAENLLLEVVEHLHEKGKIGLTRSAQDFFDANGYERSEWSDWRNELIRFLKFLDIDIPIIEESVARWKTENGIKGDYTGEIIAALNAVLSNVKNRFTQLAIMTEPLINKILDLNPIEDNVKKVRNSGINAIIHGHSPHHADRYYDENGLVIMSPHVSFPGISDSEREREGVATIQKTGKIDLIGKKFREKAPNSSTPVGKSANHNQTTMGNLSMGKPGGGEKIDESKTQMATEPEKVPGVLPVPPSAGSVVVPSVEVIAPLAPEAIRTPIEILRGHSEKIYEMIIRADGFGRLHPDTQNTLLGAFSDTFIFLHWIAPALEKYKEIILDIQANDSQLKEPENIFWGGMRIDKGKLLIPITYDPVESSQYRSDRIEPSHQIFGDGEYGFLADQGLLKYPIKYTPEIVRGRTVELAKRYSQFFAKLSVVPNWTELNQETQNNLSDVFLVYFETYPERVPSISSDDQKYSIEMSDEDKEKMKKGTPLFLREIFDNGSYGGNIITLESTTLNIRGQITQRLRGLL